MALFKILKGNEANLPSTKHEGWAYVTEKGNMYVDLSNDKRVKIGNRADTAEYADKATGDTQTIRSRYLARIKQVTSDGTQFTFRGETGDGTNAPDLISIPLAGDKAGLVSNAAQTIKGEKTFANGIKFPDVTSTTYPAASAGLTWYGSTDGAKIYYEVQASDKGMLIIEARDDTNAGAIFRNSNSKKEVSIINGLVTGTFKGNLSGTASHATSDANGKNIASYVASVLAQSDNRTIRVTKGDGTTNDVKLYFAASSSFGGAANSANVLNINNTESIGVGRMQFFQKSGDATLMPDTNWWSLVRLQHGGYASTGYWTEMAYAFHSDTIKFRRNQNGTKSAWKTIAFTDGTIAKATQAEKDWLGQVIDETYMKYPLSISGEVITMTRGDGVSSTITVPDTKVTQSETTTANYRPIILGYTNTTDTTKLSASTRNQVYASNKFYAQPSTGTLVATTFKGALDGNAKTATDAIYAEKAKGDTTTIRSTYVSSVAKNGVKVVVKKGDGTSNEFQLDFLPLAGGTMVGNIAFSKDNVIQWSRNTDFAKIGFKNDSDADADSYMYFHTGDNGNEYFKFRITSGSTVTDVLNIKNGAATFNGTVTATKFIGALQGTADYADKAKGDTVSIQSKYVSSVLKKSGSNYVLRITKGDGTYNDVDLYFAASSSCGGDANQAIKTKDLGTHTEAASGTTANAPTTGMLYSSGMYMTRTYNDTNTPCNFGNIINVAGAGTGQLLLGWSGNDNTTGDIYYRSHRDTSTGGWSPWKQVAFTDGKIKNAEFADKAKGDTTTIRSTYVKSVVKKSGSNYVFTVSKGDGTTNNVDLYFAASASCGGAALSANILNGYAESNITTRGGDGKLRYSYNIVKTATGLFAANNNANAILTINKHGGNYDSQLGFSSDGNIYYRSFNGSALNTTTGWKTIAFTDGKIKNAEFADKATGDSTTIRSTYIASIKQVTSNGTTFTFRGVSGDGTDRPNLITIPAASTSKAGLVTNAAQTWAGKKTFTGDIIIAHDCVKTMTNTSTNPQLKLGSADLSQYAIMMYTSYDSYRAPGGIKVLGPSPTDPVWFEVEGDLYVGRNLYDKEHNILLASKYVAQLIGSQGSTNYTITPRNQEGTNLTNILNVPMNLVGSANTNSKIFLVGTTSQDSKAQTGYSHDTVYIDSDGFLYDSGNKLSYHSRVSVGNTNNYKYHRIAKIDTTSNWYDGTILLYISQDYNGGKYGILRLSLRTNEISKGPSASVEAEWIARSGFALTDFKICLYSATGKAYADLYYISNTTYAGIIVKQIQQGARGSLTQGRWILTNSSEDNNTTTSDKKKSSSYKDIAAAQAGLRGGVAYTSTYDTTDASRVNESNWADRALADWNGNKFREKYIATLAVKTSSKTVFAFKGVNMEGSEISAITVPNASASVAGIITAEAQTLAGNKTLNNDLYVKGKVAVSTTSTSGYNLYVNGTSYFVGNMNLKADLVLEARIGNRLLFTDANKKVVTGSHYVNSTQIGINTTNTKDIGSYNLFVEGTTKFNGNTTHNGAVYFANGTKYYVNSEADARLRYVGVGTAEPNSKYALNVGGITTHAGNVNPEATNTRSLGTSTARWSKLFIGTADTYGSATQPIYWNAGVPKATTYSLKATVNNGSAYRLAYYSTATAISQTGHYANTTQIGINITNTTTIGDYTLYTNGTSNFADTIYIRPCRGNYCEGLRIYQYGSWSDILLGGNDLTANTGTSANSWFIGNNNGTLNITRNGSSTGTAYLRCVSNKWYINTTTGGEQLNVGGWVGTVGNAGWRSLTHGGGWYMTDASWVRSYNNKGVYTGGEMQAGTIRANGVLRSQGHALIYSNSNNAAYTSSAIEIREYNVAGAQTGAWSEAPSLTFHWGGRVQRQIRLHNNGWLYCTNDNFSSAHKLVLENGGSWNIKANTAGTSDWANYLVSNNRMAYGWNGLNYFNASMSASGAAGKNNSPTADWYHIIRMNHGNSGGYYCDIATCFHNNNMYLKRVANGSSSGWLHIWVQGNSVTSAVWNDYAECRKSDSQEPGYVMFEKGDDSLSKTIERLQHFAGIVSDTWGFSQGETADAKTNIAVAGRVLAYPYRDRNEYKPGDCVCAAPGGKVDIMTREEIVLYPDRIVGTVSCVPEYEEWGGGEGADRDPVKVNGRIWIKVK